MLRRLPTWMGAVALVVVASLAAAGAASAGRPLVTSVFPALAGSDAATESTTFARIKAAGAGMVRLGVDWASVAPAQPPASFDAADPAEPGYRWGSVDQQVTLAVKAGLVPYLTVLEAPTWAQHGHSGASPDHDGIASSSRPDSAQLALFATALATRYGGDFQGLPRVRYFQLWNEPNLARYLWPQLVDGKPVAPTLYRNMLNAFYESIHGVHDDNVVITGGLDPFRDVDPAVQKQNKQWGPLGFMRSLLCLSKALKKTCSAKVSFDVFAVHPYTSGGPTHEAQLPDDVSLGDLPEVRRMLDAARRHHTIRARNGVGFWVTEFSWDSDPPDPQAVPMTTLMQWVPEALYRMWSSGVTNVTWFLLRNERTGYFQSGLYAAGKTIAQDTPKPILKAFRFPLVALPRAGAKRYVWGRTPAGTPGTVVIEHLTFGRTTRVGRMKTDRHGIFHGVVEVGRLGYVRARLVGAKTTSAYYPLRNYPDRPVDPFGGSLDGSSS